MTFTEWCEENNKQVESIVKKLEGKEIKEVIDYFDYDNMVEKEPSFCPLYTTRSKCHDTEDLNCFFCGCPYFKASFNDTPIYTYDGIKVMSVCSLHSNKAGVFIQDNIQQCDCSKCLIPHKNKTTRKYIENVLSIDTVTDASSFLEELRAYQMSELLGKYKVF